AVTFLSGFIVIKVVSVKIGPEGIAFVGQFQNTTTILTMLSTAAIAGGVVKYLAQFRENENEANKIIGTAFVLAFACAMALSIGIMAFSYQFSSATFKSTDYWLVYFLFGLCLTAVSLNTIFLAVLNGLKEIKKFTIVNICSSLIALCCTLLGAFFFGLIGVLLASTITAVVIFFINISVFFKLGIKWRPTIKRFDRNTARMFSAFSLMAAVSGFVIPAVQIFVRNKIIHDFSVTDAGYWQAVTKISDYYLGFITTVLAVYYMPKLSELQGKAELRKEIIQGYKIILPTVGAIAFLIWLFRGLIIQLLFTEAFVSMKPLFLFQLVGDFFKIGSWLLGYLMIAKAMTKTFLITEVGFSIGFVRPNLTGSAGNSFWKVPNNRSQMIRHMPMFLSR
ncbi:MAG: O-antigen translocase, partial [Chitinophagaceae bacterium]